MSRIALITGGNRGIGFEAAKQLSVRGFEVVVAARNEQKGKLATEKLLSLGAKATFLSLDVSRSESISKAASEFAVTSKHLDVLINNAGIYPDAGVSVLTVPRQEVIETLQVNTLGPLEVTQAFLPYLRKAKAARVINVSSGYGQLDDLSPNVPSYCLSKLALIGSQSCWLTACGQRV